MKHNMQPQDKKPGQSQKPAETKRPSSTVGLSASEVEFTPSPDEVARKAYFTYVNQGSRDGHEVQHWLAAEADLIAERQLTRIHGFHHHA